MRKILMIISLLIVLCYTVAAEDMCKYLKDETAGKSIPDSIPYKTEVANVYTLDGKAVASITLNNKAFGTVECSESVKPTLRVYVKDLQTMKDIKDADDKVATFKQKMSDKDIKIKAVGFGKKIKLFFGKIALKFL